ncbi:ABC transporter ATP-binding protein [Ktedonosporobacter rubrisoli]|uniref:ABC transporter ATP-binding protein n=2 Tax=Ktedonosporobacter rubrisoli TaxID=2509675 RepID=A0A4P6K6T2_KTERU|nr:ABC transporter ATP-binding protein [Ktedonosporobacter rubrisoli]
MHLEARNVSAELAGRRIVKAVNMHVKPGELVGLIGPNGSGKSTLLRTVYRILRPRAGQILLNTDDVWKLSARESARRTGVVVQESPHDFEFTVREIVKMGRIPHKGMLARDNQDDEEIVTQALERVQMLSFSARSYATLSGGEKQRVLVARALAQQPQLFILDEPTNHLDIQHQLELLELVHTIGITTLLTLHDLNLAAAYCQRLYVLAQGEIIAEGTPEQALTPEIIKQVFHVHAVTGRHPLTGCLQLSFVPLHATEGVC